MIGRKPPSMAQLQSYNVNRAQEVESIWQPVYDYLAYPTAGALNFTFFQRSVGAGGTTLANTNMQAAGQFARPTQFLVTGIQVIFTPSGAAALGGQTLGVVQPNWVDVNAVNRVAASSLVLTIGSKPYLNEGPIGKFPPVFTIDGTGNRSDASTAGAAGAAFVDFARSAGKYYALAPFLIPANQNFNVSVQFPALVPVAGATATLGVILDGFLYRLSQ